jgi:aldehyde dehydrogenase (NAD+)
MHFIDVNEIPRLVASLQQSFSTKKTFDLSWRKQQLRQILRFLEECRNEIHEAMKADLRHSYFHREFLEIGYTEKEAWIALRELDKWATPKAQPISLVFPGAKNYVFREPYGVVLIISPWNFPLQLALCPLIGAIAAGNCAVLKPSEISTHCSILLAKYLPKYLDSECIRVVEGGPTETMALLAEKWDFICFTGSSKVGRMVIRAAAEHLTPVLLELGGKCPCIIDNELHGHAFDVAVQRITWGKYLNCGQMCVAPDYVFVPEGSEERFVAKWKEYCRKFYGEEPQKSEEYSRIINQSHLMRVAKLLEGQKNVIGGKIDPSDLYMEPTLVLNPPRDSAIMKEEIFGPVLVVLTYKNLSEVEEFVNSRPRPLAAYFFSNNKRKIEKILRELPAGGICVNDVAGQVNNELPFGGVGESGMGTYHGKYSFRTFSHKKGVMINTLTINPGIRYPPYKTVTVQNLKRLDYWRWRDVRNLLLKIFVAILVLRLFYQAFLTKYD